jgi:hypothetical protein
MYPTKITLYTPSKETVKTGLPEPKCREIKKQKHQSEKIKKSNLKTPTNSKI